MISQGVGDISKAIPRSAQHVSCKGHQYVPLLKFRNPSMWPQLSSPFECFFVFSALDHSFPADYGRSTPILVGSPRGRTARFTCPGASSAACVSPPRLLLRGSSYPVCGWLRDAWELCAPNDLLAVSAARPPNTPSRMRSAARGAAQWCTAPPTTRCGSRTRCNIEPLTPTHCPVWLHEEAARA